MEMPQTNKAPGLQSGSDQDEPPPPLQEVRSQQVGGASAAADQDQGDPDIVKSPSDPKRYRFFCVLYFALVVCLLLRCDYCCCVVVLEWLCDCWCVIVLLFLLCSCVIM